MNLLAECVNVMSKEDIKTYQSNLFTLYLEALDFRAHHDQEASDGKLLGIKSKAEPWLTQRKIIPVYIKLHFFICFMEATWKHDIEIEKKRIYFGHFAKINYFMQLLT